MIALAPLHDAPAADHGRLVDGLAALLRATAADRASIGWPATPEPDAARAFWQRCLAAAGRGERALWAATDDRGQVLGSVQLVTDMPANGAHRAELVKLMVHPQARRQGLAGRLLDAAEAEARRRGRQLVVLDTQSGSTAEPLYRARGYQLCGRIPDYAREVGGPGLDATSVMFKRLGPGDTEVRPVPHDSPDAQAMQDALSALVQARYGSDGRAAFAGFAAPGSVFALARDSAGTPLGCGALRPLAGEPGCGELKRMYAARPGQGTGRLLLRYLEHEAWVIGYRRLKLETRWANEGAVAFYRAHGFAPCENYGPYVGRPEAACFEKAIGY
ncbi:MAG: GNAT family N-acetyltransferase [Burkholderiaceae bacterium]